MSPFSLPIMDTSQTPETRIRSMLQPRLEDSDMFLTAIRIKPVNNIKVFLDADNGLDIGKCASVNRKLYHAIEESGLYPDGNFSLEVSSPGVDEPLQNLRQIKKNIGRTVEVTLKEEGAEPITGILKEASEEKLLLALKGTKKAPPKEVEILLETIKTTIVQITF